MLDMVVKTGQNGYRESCRFESELKSMGIVLTDDQLAIYREVVAKNSATTLSQGDSFGLGAEEKRRSVRKAICDAKKTPRQVKAGN